MSELLNYNNYYKEEMIDGKIYLMAPSGTPSHGKVIGNLLICFGNYLKGKACSVFGDNLDVYYNEKNYVTPDLTIVCDKSKFSKRGYEGVPSLVAEVLSKSSWDYDRINKFNLYEKMGIKEYWLVDYNNELIEQYILINDKYELKNTIVIIEEWELEKIAPEKRNDYTSIIKPTIFDDFEFDIKDVFDFDF